MFKKNLNYKDLESFSPELAFIRTQARNSVTLAFEGYQEKESRRLDRSEIYSKVNELTKSFMKSTTAAAPSWLSDLVISDLVGLGIFDFFLSHAEILEVGIYENKYFFSCSEDNPAHFLSKELFISSEKAFTILSRVAETLGTRLDERSPLLSSRWNSEWWVEGTLPPASPPEGWIRFVRRHEKGSPE